ncbi:MAG: DUF4397 domain-containing protein, partial [Chloroflexota bacterium]
MRRINTLLLWSLALLTACAPTTQQPTLTPRPPTDTATPAPTATPLPTYAPLPTAMPTLDRSRAQNPERGRIRVVNAVNGLPTFDALLGDQTVAFRVRYGSVSGTASVDAGAYTLRLVPSDGSNPDGIATSEITLEQDRPALVIVSGTANAPVLDTIYELNEPIATDRARLSLFHAVAT